MFNQKDSFFLFWLCPHQRVGLPWAGSSHYPKVAATGPGITYLHDNLQQQRTMTPQAAYVLSVRKPSSGDFNTSPWPGGDHMHFLSWSLAKEWYD